LGAVAVIIGPVANQKKTQFIRLWDGVLPRVLRPSGSVLRFAQASITSKSLNMQRILAIEMKIGHGPKITYGLLGLAYQAAVSEQVKISILVSEDKEGAFEDAITPPGILFIGVTLERLPWRPKKRFSLVTGYRRV
jgi:hypothetical protein